MTNGVFPIQQSSQEGRSNNGGVSNAFGFGTVAQRVPGLYPSPADWMGYYSVGRRRGDNSARPSVLGACGLVNLGNTCFLNTALQCLSHTPLFRAYLLSNRFLLDVNRQVRFAVFRSGHWVWVCTYFVYNFNLF